MTPEGREIEDVMIRTHGANLVEWERYTLRMEPMPLAVRFRWWRRRMRDHLMIRERPDPFEERED
jgi:hypothetical protein